MHFILFNILRIVWENRFHPKDSRKGYMEGRLDREFSYPKDDSCIRFVEHLDFLKKIVGIES